jgi:hypothetical protein
MKSDSSVDLLPPRPALRLAFPLVLIVGVAVARAGAVGGTVALVGTLFGLATVAATAIGAPPLLTGFGVAVGACALAAAASAAHGVPAAVAPVVAVGALTNGALTRVGSIEVLLPVIAAICGLLDVENAHQTERDHRALLDAIATERVVARSDL